MLNAAGAPAAAPRARRACQAGFTLVELMIGLTIGTLVVWSMSAVYANTSRGSRTAINANQLNQDLRAVMDIVTGDLRRAGYWGAAANRSNNPFATDTTRPHISNLVAGSADCVLYSYDATYAGGTAGNVEAGVDFFGFRLADGAVQMVDPLGATLASTATACNDASLTWQNLTDQRAIAVTRLTFDTVGSQCIAFRAASYSPSDSTTYTAWTTTAGSGPACAPGASGAPVAYPDPALHTFVETRQIRVTLTASSVADPTLAVTLGDSVLVRNNRIVSP